MSQLVCKNCGEPLSPSNKFCPNCGAKVETAIGGTEALPHIAQAERKAMEDPEEKPKHRTFHIERFDWNTDGYPDASKHTKTQDVDFDWSSKIEKRINDRRENGRPSLYEEPEQEAEETQSEAPAENAAETVQQDNMSTGNNVTENEEVITEAEEPAAAYVGNNETVEEAVSAPDTTPEATEEAPAEEKAVNVETTSQPAEHEKKDDSDESDKSLQRAIFGYTSDDEDQTSETAAFQKESTQQIDKFYTYSKKNEEFQNLLDKEYDRLKTQNTRPEGLQKKEAEEAAKAKAQKEAAEKIADEPFDAAGFVTPETMTANRKSEPASEETVREAVEAANNDAAAAGLFATADNNQEEQVSEKPQEEAPATEEKPETVQVDEPTQPIQKEEPEAEDYTQTGFAAGDTSWQGLKPEEGDADAPNNSADIAAEQGGEPEIDMMQEQETAAEPKPVTEQVNEAVQESEPEVNPNNRFAQILSDTEDKEHEAKMEAEKEKQKLTFQEVFDDDEDQNYPRHTALKVICILILILIILEVVAIVIRKFAPNSSVGQWIGTLYNNIFSALAGQ